MPLADGHGDDVHTLGAHSRQDMRSPPIVPKVLSGTFCWWSPHMTSRGHGLTSRYWRYAQIFGAASVGEGALAMPSFWLPNFWAGRAPPWQNGMPLCVGLPPEIRLFPPTHFVLREKVLQSPRPNFSCYVKNPPSRGRERSMQP